MMCFGFSGRQSLHQEQELITGSNQIRASILADLVESQRVIIRRVHGGQVYSYPNPAFESAIRTGYTYDRDWIATLQAFRQFLDTDGGLCSLAEYQGVTVEGVEFMIEQIRESSVTKTRKRRRLDA